MENQIKTNAEFVIQQLGPLSGFQFGYNAESVAWVDGFIEQQRGSDADTINGLINTLGSFLGECIIRCFGGHWQNIAGEWGVCFDDQNIVFPFSKVRKQFTNNREDSIKKFFELIPVMFKQYLQKSDQSLTTDSMKQLEFFIRQAEEAYDRIYDARSNYEGTVAYNDCKENMRDAIYLAKQLGFEQKAIELEKKLEHYKNVFRHQMNF